MVKVTYLPVSSEDFYFWIWNKVLISFVNIMLSVVCNPYLKYILCVSYKENFKFYKEYTALLSCIWMDVWKYVYTYVCIVL